MLVVLFCTDASQGAGRLVPCLNARRSAGKVAGARASAQRLVDPAKQRAYISFYILWNGRRYRKSQDLIMVMSGGLTWSASRLITPWVMSRTATREHDHWVLDALIADYLAGCSH